MRSDLESIYSNILEPSLGADAIDIQPLLSVDFSGASSNKSIGMILFHGDPSPPLGKLEREPFRTAAGSPQDFTAYARRGKCFCY